MLRFAIFISITLVTSTFGVLAQEVTDAKWIHQDTTDYQLKPIAYWAKGEKMKYIAKKVEETYDGDSLLNTKTTYEQLVEFAVLDSSEKSYKIKYHIVEDLRKNKRDQKTQEAIEYLTENISLDGIETVDLIYTTDEEGAFDTLENNEKVLNLLGQMGDTFSKRMLDTLKFDSPTKKKGAEKYLKLMLSKEKIFENMYSIFLSSFHNFHGYQSGVNDTISYKEHLTFGSKKVINNCYIFISSVDTTTNEIKYVQEKYGDQESYKAVLGDLLAETLLTDTPKSEIDKIEYGLFLKNVVWINMTTGWPSYVSFIKNVEAGGEKEKVKTKIEYWTLELKTD
jgi:hypothetical protein